MATRRDVLGGAAASLGGAAFPALAASPALVCAARVGGRDGGGLWQSGTLTPFALPGRGHAIARSPLTDHVVLVGRRPGVFAALVRTADLDAPARVLAPAAGCRFAGHAAFAPDGRAMITSEFDADSMAGVLVARGPGGEARERWSLPGIEPHELRFAAGGARLVVAMGGLIKDGGVAGPAFNPEGVDSAVLEIDPRSGRVLARHKLAPDLASLSLRHLPVSPDGRAVVVAMQDQDLSQARPLVGMLRLGGKIELLPMPDPRDCDFRGYLGSVAVDAGGRFICATSPRGGVAGLWSMGDGRWLGALDAPDICGLAAGAGPGAFWATTGYGEVLDLTASGAGLLVRARWKTAAGFDNHLLRL